MPTQPFNIYTARGYAGDLVDSGPRTTQTGVVENAELGFGLAIKRGTVATNPRHILKGSPVAVFGISLRELNNEAKNKPSDGTTTFSKTESATYIREGYVYVVAVAACTAGQLMFVNATDGTFSGTAAGSHVESTNVTAEQSVAAGEVVKVRIDVV